MFPLLFSLTALVSQPDDTICHLIISEKKRGRSSKTKWWNVAFKVGAEFTSVAVNLGSENVEKIN